MGDYGSSVDQVSVDMSIECQSSWRLRVEQGTISIDTALHMPLIHMIQKV